MQNSPIAHQRVLNYAYVDTDTLYQDFQIPQQGYNEKQVEESRIAYGRNVLSGRASDTVLYRLRRAFVNPFTVILFVLAAVSFLTDVVLASNFSRNITTSVIILCMLLLSGIVRFIQELRAKRIADHLTRMVSSTVQVLRNGRWSEISSEELVVGDKVRLFAGDRIPADIRLTQSKDLFVSQSVLTGESAILEKNAGTLADGQARSYSDYYNLAFMGSSVTGGTGEGIVLAVGKDTVYGGFSSMESHLKNGFDRGANSIAWVLIRFMAVLIPVIFIACGLTKGDWLSAFLFALSVAVGLTPEMLPMVINACLAKGSAAMDKKQTVVKNINAMQGFGSMDVLCVDKTGTLTGDQISLEYYMDVLGNECQHALDLAYLNSLYHTGVQNHLDDAILRYREMPGQESHYRELEQRHPKLDELPFDHERRFASVLVRHGTENLLIIKGSVDEVCRKCSHIEHRGEWHPIDAHGRDSVHAIVDEMLEDGMKVLAVAYKPLNQETISQDDENGLTLLGYLAFFDAPKQSAAAAIEKLHRLHVDVRVLTGDNDKVTRTICKQVGLRVRNMLLGSDLEHMSDAELARAAETTDVFAKLTPDQKARVVSVLRENGHTVGFMGDGINDAAAMKAADIGISVDTAVDVAKESADIILLEKDLMVLEQGIIEGRKTYANMIKYIKMTASSNFGNMFSVLAASALLPFLPMMSVHLIFLNLIYDLSCTAIPWDNVDEEFIAKPRKWDASSVGNFMIWIGPTSSIFDFTTYLFMYFVFCPIFVSGGVLFNDLPAHFSGAELAMMQAKYIGMFQTGWFVESMWSQTLVIHMIRTPKLPFIQSRASAPLTLLTMMGITILTIIPFTPFGAMLGFTALPAAYFAYLIPCILLYMVLATSLKKAYARHYGELL